MHALDFLHRDATQDVRPIYALFGDDAYLKAEALAAIVRSALGEEADDLGIARFSGEQADLADVLDEVGTLPFLTRRRVAVVDGADPFVTAHRKELESYVERPAASGVLVLVVKVWSSATKLARLVEKTGLAVECKSPRESDLPRWLSEFARRRHGAKLVADAAALLIELVGPDVGLLASEVQKLAVYVGERRTIHPDDVATMVGGGRVETIWKALEAATTGQAAEAMEDLDRLIASGEHPVGLLAAMSASLRKVHHAGRLRRMRRDLREACKEAGIPSFPAAIELTGRQHAHLGPSRVDRLPELLLRADLDLKGASMLPPRTVLERLLIRLAEPRRD